MKVYVVKRCDGKYLSGYSNYDYRLENPCKPCWTEKLYNAKVFEEYDEADIFCNTIDCQIVECSFMEPTELTNYTKQVRKEVCEKFKENIENIEKSIVNNPSYFDNEERKRLVEKAVYKNVFKFLDKESDK